MITENDVRLLRRILVCLQHDDRNHAREIADYLRGRFEFILPEEQKPGEVGRYIRRLQPDEIELVEAYGCVLLPEYNDIIFLNRKWSNPRTLYVRLVEPVAELGKLGEVYWAPVNTPGLAIANQEYRRQSTDGRQDTAESTAERQAPKSFLDRLFGR